MITMKILLQCVSVVSLGIGAYLNIKKSRWCFVFYQIGATARMLNYVSVGLHIELIVQFFFTWINYKGFVTWSKSK